MTDRTRCPERAECGQSASKMRFTLNPRLPSTTWRGEQEESCICQYYSPARLPGCWACSGTPSFVPSAMAVPARVERPSGTSIGKNDGSGFAEHWHLRAVCLRRCGIAALARSRPLTHGIDLLAALWLAMAALLWDWSGRTRRLRRLDRRKLHSHRRLPDWRDRGWRSPLVILGDPAERGVSKKIKQWGDALGCAATTLNIPRELMDCGFRSGR